MNAHKQCNNCNADLPLTEEHWHRDSHNPDGSGFRNTCKKCRNSKLSLEKELIVDDAFERLKKKGIESLTHVTEGGSNVPHLAEVYQCLMQAFGGPRLFAQHTAACYFDPNTSQSTKQKLLQMVVNVSAKVSESGMIARDLEQVPTEELRKLLETRVNEAVQQHQARIVQMPTDGEGDDVQRAAG